MAWKAFRPKLIRAQYDGWCRGCGSQIREGERIWYGGADREGPRVWHEECRTEDGTDEAP